MATDTARRLKFAQRIVDFEARRDANCHIRLYRLPANDGGGKWEYAGINDRYHPGALKQITGLVQTGQHAQAEALAVAYIANYTEAAGKWVSDPAAEFYLRDCIWNRGPTGAAKILQMAVGVKADGLIGPKTREAIAKKRDLLPALRAARERYEDVVAPGRPNLRRGLVNRWNGALKAAEEMAA